MLLRLLRTYLRPYFKQLAIIVVLQLAATVASLYLPTINGEIIDRGVATGDTGYVLAMGAVMLAIAAVQIVCSAAQPCLISVTQASLAPTEEADAPISFAG